MDSRRKISGVALIVLGVVMFLLQFAEGVGEWVTLAGIGLVFLFIYFARKSPAFLIPGCILVGLGIGGLWEGQGLATRNFSDIGLALGFVAIWVIRLFHEKENTWWPLIPGAILMLNGIGVRSEQYAKFFQIGWPLVFVLLGAWVLYSNRGQGQGSADAVSVAEEKNE